MKIMGHTDMRTTLKHYTDLRLVDTGKALATLPDLQSDKNVKAGEAQREGAAQTPPLPAPMCAKPPNAGPKLRIAGQVDDGMQVLYTAPVSCGLRHPASPSTTIHDKSFIINDLRAVGAVG